MIQKKNKTKHVVTRKSCCCVTSPKSQPMHHTKAMIMYFLLMLHFCQNIETCLFLFKGELQFLEIHLSHLHREQPTHHDRESVWSDINIHYILQFIRTHDQCLFLQFSLHQDIPTSIYTSAMIAKNAQRNCRAKMCPRSSQKSSGSCVRLLFNYFSPAECKEDPAKTVAEHSLDKEQNLKLQMRSENTFKNIQQPLLVSSALTELDLWHTSEN